MALRPPDCGCASRRRFGDHAIVRWPLIGDPDERVAREDAKVTAVAGSAAPPTKKVEWHAVL